MKKTFLIFLILFDLIVIFGCSKDKKSNANSENTNSTGNVSANITSKAQKIVENKYLGHYFYKRDSDFGERYTSEFSIFKISSGEAYMLSALHEGNHTGGELTVYTNGNELWRNNYESQPDELLGKFTDVNTFMPEGNWFFGGIHKRK